MSRSRLAIILGALVAGVILLAIPGPQPLVPPAPARARAFVWNQDSLWRGLERRFTQARATGCADSSVTSAGLVRLDALITRVASVPHGPQDAVFDSLEASFFAAAPAVAACGPLVARYADVHARMREAVSLQSAAWDQSSQQARDRMYRALYGGRAAVEEVMLQQPAFAPSLVRNPMADTASVAGVPSAVSNGVTLHSGDMLISRGGYPTSALIARGNDYPGNFSHVALVQIDSSTHAISVVEAHIEIGVAVSPAEKYLADKKLRVLVVRPRRTLALLQKTPALPHLAASAMLARAQHEHIPYDFAMDYTDPSRLFCSEVASAAYHTQGLTLWMGISTISRRGIRHWLSAFGVRHFATQEPSDLEYDPQLQVVAEWHDPKTLFNDHVDNAVTDAMLEWADKGDRLSYDWYALPVARLMKLYSWARVQTGGHGPIPEGMSASAALRNKAYGARHAKLAAAVRRSAGEWQREHGYPPMYWTLVDLAREEANHRLVKYASAD